MIKTISKRILNSLIGGNPSIERKILYDKEWEVVIVPFGKKPSTIIVRNRIHLFLDKNGKIAKVVTAPGQTSP